MLLAVAALSLGVCAMNGAIGEGYALASPRVTRIEPHVGHAAGGTTVTARTPEEAAGLANVTVTTPEGPLRATRFTYRPVVTSVTPNEGPTSGGTSVNIAGSALAAATSVMFGSVPTASFTVNSNTSVTAVAPEHRAGNVYVRVITPEGSSRKNVQDRYTFVARPTIRSVRPDTGSPLGGTMVTIKGRGFAVGETATKIEFEGTPATAVDCTSSKECTAVSPAHRRSFSSTEEVNAIVKGQESPSTTGDEFSYRGIVFYPHNLVLIEELGAAGEGCLPYVSGFVGVNDETTDVIDARGLLGAEPSCKAFFGALPSDFNLSVSLNGDAAIAGPMGVSTYSGCVYEGHELSGGWSGFHGLGAELSGTFELVRNESQEETCPATAGARLNIEVPEQQLEVEILQ